MTQILRFEKPEEQVAEPNGFVHTKTADAILLAIAKVRSQDGPALTYVSGAYGCGKTEALWNFESRNFDSALYVSVARGEGNPYHVGNAILRLFTPHAATVSDRSVLRQRMGYCLGPRRILLVDEAQNLFQRDKHSGIRGSSFGWLVDASQECGFDLVLCGDPTLHGIIAMEFPALQSRAESPVIIKSISGRDVAAIAASHGVSGGPELALLSAVAGLPGGLRAVRKVLDQAAIFAKFMQVTPAHLKAAVAHLNLQPREVK